MSASWLRLRELLRKEMRQLLRDPKTRRIMFGAPVIQLLLFGYAATTDMRDASTVVVDHDRTLESRWLVDALAASGYFRIVERADGSASIARALDHGTALLGVEIPAGFARDLRAGREPAVQLLVDGSSSNSATVAQGHASRIIQRFAADRRADQRSGAYGAAGAAPAGVELRARAWYNPSLTSRLYNVPAVIGLLLLLMALLLTALAVVRERELGTLEQLRVSPLTAVELMLGKTIPAAVIAFIDLAIVAGLAVLWFGVPFRGSLAALLLASFIYIVAGIGFGLLISTISRTQQEAFLGMFLLFLPAVVLSGFMYPVLTMPAFFQKLTLFNPVRLFIEIVRGLFLRGASVAELGSQYLLLALIAGLVLTAAVWRFRRMLA
jgi:ABC-2 type transport system permease protein